MRHRGDHALYKTVTLFANQRAEWDPSSWTWSKARPWGTGYGHIAKAAVCGVGMRIAACRRSVAARTSSCIYNVRAADRLKLFAEMTRCLFLPGDTTQDLRRSGLAP